MQTLSTVSPQLTVAELCPSIDPNDLKSLFLAFDTKDYLAIDSTLKKITNQNFYPKQVLIGLVDMAIDAMALNHTTPSFIFNSNKMIETILPVVNSLGINANALANCRLALYEVLTKWDSSVQLNKTEPTSSSPIQMPAAPAPVPQPMPRLQPQTAVAPIPQPIPQPMPQPVPQPQVQQMPQLYQPAAVTVQAEQSLPVTQQSITPQQSMPPLQQPVQQFVFPTGHVPYR